MRLAPFAQLVGTLLLAIGQACHADPSEIVPADTIVIDNTGSTNTIGYRIVVAVHGETSYTSGAGRGTSQLPVALLSKLKFDVVMAQPLSHVRARKDCMKPVSFGTSTTVALGDERTGDLACAASPKGEALKSDAGTVAAFLHVGSVPRGEGHDLPPAKD